MKTVLFVMFSSPSHYHSTFDFARKWEQKGYRIIYTGLNNVKQTVEAEGFTFYQFDYSLEYIIHSFKAFFGIYLKTLLDPSFLRMRYRDFCRGEARLENLVDTIKPSQIFVDEHLSEYCLCFKRLNIPTRVLCTKLSSRRSWGVPPMNSYFIPDGSWLSAVVCDFLWFKHYSKVVTKSFIRKVAFGGLDEKYFLRRQGSKYGYDPTELIDERNFFFKGIKGLPRVIMGTEKIELPWRKKYSDETYCFLPITRNENKYLTPEYYQLIQDLVYSRNNGKKIIYCSFGTVSFKDLERVKKFTLKLLDGIKSQSNVILVLSRGNQDWAFLPQPNVYYLDFLPQLHFLTYCDLMITHGGHNSVKECLQKGVPMLVYPHMEDNDQPGDAARVQLAGFGLMGKIEKDSSHTIWMKINKLLLSRTDIFNWITAEKVSKNNLNQIRVTNSPFKPHFNYEKDALRFR